MKKVLLLLLIIACFCACKKENLGTNQPPDPLLSALKQFVAGRISPGNFDAIPWHKAIPIKKNDAVQGYAVTCQQDDGYLRQLVALKTGAGWDCTFREIRGNVSPAGLFNGEIGTMPLGEGKRQWVVVENNKTLELRSQDNNYQPGNTSTAQQDISADGISVYMRPDLPPGVVVINGRPYFWAMPAGGWGTGSSSQETVVTYISNEPSADSGGDNGVSLDMFGVNFSFLDNALNLTTEEEDWLRLNLDVAREVYQSLVEDIYSRVPAVLTPGAVIASRVTISVAMDSLFAAPFTTTWYNKTEQALIVNGVRDPVTSFTLRMLANFSFLKVEHPEWSDWRTLWEATKLTAHEFLDYAGLIPFAGEIADLTNGLIYTIEGDGVNATLSFASTIPIAGWFPAGIKLAKRVVIAVNNSKTVLRWTRLTSGAIDFGDRGQLRRVLGLAVGDPHAAHHIIAWEHRTHPLVQRAAQAPNAFHMNEGLNGIPLLPVQHGGGHINYNRRILDRLEDVWANDMSISPKNARKEIDKLMNEIRGIIDGNSNIPVDNLIF